MSRTAVFMLSLPIAASLAALAFAEVNAIEPVNVVFRPIVEVFVKGNTARRAAEETKKRYLGRSLVLDGIVQDTTGRIWCRRTLTGGYKNPFREKDVSLKKLESLQRASGSELITLLGEPVFRDGPLDAEGTVVWKWGTCNGGLRERFQAIEVAAGFKGGATNNALFLLVALGLRK